MYFMFSLSLRTEMKLVLAESILLFVFQYGVYETERGTIINGKIQPIVLEILLSSH